MRPRLLYSALISIATLATGATASAMAAAPGAFAFKAALASGQLKALSDYSGKALLIANVASRCGYTQSGYADLSALAKKYASQGLQILIFPCNQFGKQEPGTDEEIVNFAAKKGAAGEGVDIFSKIDVKGAGAHELFQFLSDNADDSGAIKWNFEYFLIHPKDGSVVARYRSGAQLQDKAIASQIEAVLKEATPAAGEARQEL